MEYIQCPHCQKKYGVNDKARASVGKNLRCKACQQSFVITILNTDDQPGKAADPQPQAAAASEQATPPATQQAAAEQVPEETSAPVEENEAETKAPAEETEQATTSEESEEPAPPAVERPEKPEPVYHPIEKEKPLNPLNMKTLISSLVALGCLMAGTVYYVIERSDIPDAELVLVHPEKPKKNILLEAIEKQIPELPPEEEPQKAEDTATQADGENSSPDQQAAPAPDEEPKPYRQQFNASLACLDAAAMQWQLDYAMTNTMLDGEAFVRTLDQSVKAVKSVREQCKDEDLPYEITEAAKLGEIPNWLKEHLQKAAENTPVEAEKPLEPIEVIKPIKIF